MSFARQNESATIEVSSDYLRDRHGYNYLKTIDLLKELGLVCRVAGRAGYSTLSGNKHCKKVNLSFDYRYVTIENAWNPTIQRRVDRYQRKKAAKLKAKIDAHPLGAIIQANLKKVRHLHRGDFRARIKNIDINGRVHDDLILMPAKERRSSLHVKGRPLVEHDWAQCHPSILPLLLADAGYSAASIELAGMIAAHNSIKGSSVYSVLKGIYKRLSGKSASRSAIKKYFQYFINTKSSYDPLFGEAVRKALPRTYAAVKTLVHVMGKGWIGNQLMRREQLVMQGFYREVLIPSRKGQSVRSSA